MRDFEKETVVGVQEEQVEQSTQLEQRGNTKFSAQGSVPGVAKDGGEQQPSASQLVYKDDAMGMLEGGLSKFTGGGFFSGAGPQLTNSIPPLAKPKPQTEPGNKAFEDDPNMHRALYGGVDANGRETKPTAHPVPNVDGKTFTATGCWTGIGEVAFTFDRAAVGQFIDHSKEANGAIIQMSVRAKNCGNPKSIRLLQVCRDFKLDEQKQRVVDPPQAFNSRPEHDDNNRLRRSGYTYDKKTDQWSKTPTGPSAGWRVDQDASNLAPWFGGTGTHDGHSGRNGDANTPAIQRDAPGTFSERAYNVGKEFRTCAVAYDENDKGSVLASIEWGYYCEKPGVVHFDEPRAYEGANVEVYDASDRWNTLKDGQGNQNVNTGIERPFKP